jgi:hypothetical protein
MIVEGILRLVPVERHPAFELRVAALQLEVFLDHLREEGGSLHRHAFLPCR